MKQSLCLLFLFISALSSHSQEGIPGELLTTFKNFIGKYQEGPVVFYDRINISEADSLELQIARTNTEALDLQELISFYINAYNILVISSVAQSDIRSSVRDIPGFFRNQHIVGGKSLSLDELESLIVAASGDPFTHLLLNCGALSCPPLQYISPENPLDGYISSSLKSAQIIEADDQEKKLYLSKIFFWYRDAFRSDGNWLKRMETLSGKEGLHEYEIIYIPYDWNLNAPRSGAPPVFIPTKLYGKGGWELKIFNNYYTQKEADIRNNFFSTFFQLLIGTGKRINLGVDVKLRSVTYGKGSMFDALAFRNQMWHLKDGQPEFARWGISGIGPRIRYQPIEGKGNINMLHAIYFVPMKHAEGNADYGYVDFQNIQIFNNVWYEKEYSVKHRLFMDIGLHIENLSFRRDEGEPHFMQILQPVTVIYSYYPTPKSTLYGLANVAQKIEFLDPGPGGTDVRYSGFGQLGAGGKYYLSNQLELEILYTRFFDGSPGRVAHTFNLGARIFIY